MIAEILSVGTEILLGDIINTNANFLSKELAQLGITVYYQTVVGDNRSRLYEAYKIAFERSDIVITTGGLGPTDDDITKEIGSSFFNRELYFNKEIYEKIKNYFNNLSIILTENNNKQVFFPVDSIILENDNGTAPGCLIEENNKILIMLPGPPNEMVPMFKNTVIPILKTKTDEIFYSKTLRICGIGESYLEELIKKLLDNQSNPSIALYAKIYEVHIRITAKAKNQNEAQTIINPIVEELYKLLGENIYAEDDKTLEETVIEIIKNQKRKISIAESCTGGLIASKIVGIPGVSNILLEGLVTYSNESKIKRLGVKKETIEKYNVVSSQVAIEMAEGVANFLNSSIGLSTTGLAGPGGDVKNNIGLVYIGLTIDKNCFFKEVKIYGNREKIRERASVAALDFLRRKLLKSIDIASNMM